MYKNLGFACAFGTSELSYVGISHTGIAIRIRGKSIVSNPAVDFYVREHFKKPAEPKFTPCGKDGEWQCDATSSEQCAGCGYCDADEIIPESCPDCGGLNGEHYPTCQPGCSEEWQKFYSEEDEQDLPF
jgi:hypothetical protein